MPARRRPDEPRWPHRPVLATTVRVAVFTVPFLASLVAAWAVAGLLGTPDGAGERVLWWAGVLAASLGALLVFDRAARRLLPLAALLELSLIFPDRAPSRFGVALRSGSTKRLHASELAALRRGDQEPAEAARTILTLAGSLSTHDRDTRGHSERVRAYADLIGAELGLEPADRDRLRWAALLHDLGKVTVPAHTLNHAGVLTDEDWETLRRHPLEGARLAEPLRDWLGPWALAIEQHHERFDGTGYPYGLRGDDLSLAARIVAVADSYDAMTSLRSYNPPMSAAAARQELAAQAGTHFDPVVVRAFLSISLGRLRWVLGPLAFFAAAPFAPALGGVRRSLDSAGRTAVLGAGSLIATVSILQTPAPPETPSASTRTPRAVVEAPARQGPAPETVAGAEGSTPVSGDPASAAGVAGPATTGSTPSSPAAAAASPKPGAHPAPPVPAALPVTTVAPAPPPEEVRARVPITAAPQAPTTTPPTSVPEDCRVSGNDHSNRPCQPPRWGEEPTP